MEQQFQTMDVIDLDKLNIIHICLKGDAQHCFKQNKPKFLRWSIFIQEITDYFRSHL